MRMMGKFLDFGFKSVSAQEKKGMVKTVFSSVASKYDLMNDLMSLGMHRCWKKSLLSELNLRAGLLDIAGGTGDISKLFIDAGGKYSVVCDINEEMVKFGSERLTGYKSISWTIGDAENLPFPDATWEQCVISFGIRNVPYIDKALQEAYRVLKIGGRFICLEFSDVTLPVLSQLYDFYSFNIIPKLGHYVASNEEAYQYLVESIRKFPNAQKFALMIQEAGFSNVYYYKMTFGVVAIHIGYKSK